MKQIAESTTSKTPTENKGMKITLMERPGQLRVQYSNVLVVKKTT
jgi:hypothetical protein